MHQLLHNRDRRELPGPLWCGSVLAFNSLGDASEMSPSEEQSEPASWAGSAWCQQSWRETARKMPGRAWWVLP